MPDLGYLLKLFVFERDTYFWNKGILMLSLTLTFRTAKNLCPNL